MKNELFFYKKGLFLFFLLIVTFPLFAYNDTLRIAVCNDVPPYSYYNEDGKLVGLDIDIVSTLMHEMNYHYRLYDYSSQELATSIKEHQIDLVMGGNHIFYENIDFSYSIPYHCIYYSAFFYNKTKINKVVFDLKNKKVVLLKNRYSKYVSSYLRDLVDTIVFTESVVQGLSSVKQNKYDAFLCDKSTSLFMCKKDSTMSNIIVQEIGVPPIPISVLCVNKNPFLLKELNKGLSQLNFSGEFNSIYSKWLGYPLPSFVLLKMKVIVAIISVVLIAIMIIVFFIYLRFNKKAKHALRRKVRLETIQKELSGILYELPVGLMVLDHQGYITGINKAEEELLGISEAELLTRKTNMLDSSYCSEEMRQAFWEGNSYTSILKYKKRELMSEQKYSSFSASYEKLYIYYRGVPLKDEDGSLLRYLLVLQDVSAEENLKRVLIREKNEAEQSNKLKSAFLANMSHEIRTPLNSIVGFSELIAMSPDLDEKERYEYTEHIRTNTEILLRLINDILDLSKIEAGFLEFTPTKFDLNKLMREIYSSLKMKHEEANFVFRLVCPEEPYYVVMDEKRLAQVVMNFLTNAVKYTEKGFIEIRYKPCKEGIRIEVEDSGLGIAPENHKNVFERFQKFDRFKSGNGIGLHLVKTIVEKQGGEVGFRSKLGKGSVFWAYLPNQK